MSVDLGNLVDAARAAVNAPGEDNFPNGTDDDYLLRLINGFWGAVLDGIIVGYSVDDNGIVTPNSGTTDLDREFQQVVIFYMAIDVVTNALRSINTMTHSVAGPVEFEIQKSANTLRDVLKELQNRRAIILRRLSDVGSTKSSYVDGVLARDLSQHYGEQPYVSGVQGGWYGWGR